MDIDAFPNNFIYLARRKHIPYSGNVIDPAFRFDRVRDFLLHLFKLRVFFVLFFFWAGIHPALAGTASIAVSETNDGWVYVTANGSFETCVTCYSDGTCTTRDSGNVYLFVDNCDLTGCLPYCQATGHGSASCTKQWERSTFNGSHMLKAKVTDCIGTVISQQPISLNNAPSINAICPSVVSSPFNILATATFIPNAGAVNKYITATLSSAGSNIYLPDKLCTSRTCFYNYEELAGKLYSAANGTWTLTFTAVGQPPAIATYTFTISNTASTVDNNKGEDSQCK